jgi:prevent-host-death family protein
MPPSLKQPTNRRAKLHKAVSALERWKLEDAKARFSEVVRLAATGGPQLVTIRGKEAAVILAPEQYEQLLPKPKGRQSLVHFLQGLGLEKIQIERERDTGRELLL